MKRVKYVFCVLAVALLTVLPALAAEGEGQAAQGYAQVELFQDGMYGSEGGTSTRTEQPLEEVLYQTLYTGLQERKTEISLSALDMPYTEANKALLQAVFTEVVDDHPELYYVTKGYQYSGYTNGTFIRVVPNYDPELLAADPAQFQRALDEALSLVDDSMSDLEKALVLHDYLVLHVAYNWEVATRQPAPGKTVYTAYGALVEGDAVCQGYALAYKLLMDRCGIPCEIVSSEAMNHAWNAVQIDGQWYHMDATWDDPTPDLAGSCSYDNFLRSDAGITDTGHHDWTCSEEITFAAGDLGGVFRSSNTALYCWKDAYYFLEIDAGRGILYRTDSLNGTPEEETGIEVYKYVFNGNRYYPAYGTVWIDGKLYYVSRDMQLCYLELDSMLSASLGTIPFEAEDSADGYYDSTRDTIGLRYDSQSGLLEAVSRTRPEVTLAAFQPVDYPPAWDQNAKDVTALAGARWEDHSTLQMGVVYAGSGDIPALWAAFYDNGEMTGISRVDTSALTRGLNILELTAPAERTKEVRLFLLSAGSWTPCGEKVTVP